MIGLPETTKRMYQARVKSALTSSRLLSLIRHQEDLKLLVSRWSIKSYTFVAVQGEFAPSLEYVARLTMLHLFSEANVVVIILE